ncbi:LbetaH domain-containing protein [Pseudooceanicola sp. 502str34]
MPKLSADTPYLHPETEIEDSQLGAWTEVGRGTRFNNVQLGDYSYCDRFCDFANTRVGKFANIASFVRVGATDHPLEGASLHHFLYRSADYWEGTPRDDAFFARRRARITEIGHDTWLGHNAQVKPGIRVGHGAVVASGAIVTKDVGDYEIVAGTPAKPIRLRQPREIADRLIALGWWDWDHARLGAALEDFRALKAEAFLEKYGG